jgi:hypothetical protein
MLKFITKDIHALLDYPVALGLILMPFLFDLTGVALILSVATGIAALLLTLLTDHKLGLVRVVPYKVHLAVDFLVGLTFLAAPTVFGLAGIEAMYFWVLGATVLVVVGLHKELDTVLAA